MSPIHKVSYIHWQILIPYSIWNKNPKGSRENQWLPSAILQRNPMVMWVLSLQQRLFLQWILSFGKNRQDGLVKIGLLGERIRNTQKKMSKEQENNDVVIFCFCWRTSTQDLFIQPRLSNYLIVYFGHSKTVDWTINLTE